MAKPLNPPPSLFLSGENHVHLGFAKNPIFFGTAPKSKSPWAPAARSDSSLFRSFPCVLLQSANCISDSNGGAPQRCSHFRNLSAIFWFCFSLSLCAIFCCFGNERNRTGGLGADKEETKSKSLGSSREGMAVRVRSNIGFWIRETGQALDRAGCQFQRRGFLSCGKSFQNSSCTRLKKCWTLIVTTLVGSSVVVTEATPWESRAEIPIAYESVFLTFERAQLLIILTDLWGIVVYIFGRRCEDNQSRGRD